MTTTELNTAKLEFIREFLNEKDEDLVKEQIAFYRSLKHTDIFLNIPRTEEKLKAPIEKAEKDYHNGIFFSNLFTVSIKTNR
ncbi:hypothetical protein [uncultured Proteiniphilum sp.]|uniref:hypothetical protein n=1 Tax=uncultured Proteiniphilum sp. TaxID=497637 RepID=UPI002612B7B4|nr:hypothetical protein [uncultured Proteiniphilum sp.]